MSAPVGILEEPHPRGCGARIELVNNAQSCGELLDCPDDIDPVAYRNAATLCENPECGALVCADCARREDPAGSAPHLGMPQGVRTYHLDCAPCDPPPRLQAAQLPTELPDGLMWLNPRTRLVVDMPRMPLGSMAGVFLPFSHRGNHFLAVAHDEFVCIYTNPAADGLPPRMVGAHHIAQEPGRSLFWCEGRGLVVSSPPYRTDFNMRNQAIFIPSDMCFGFYKWSHHVVSWLHPDMPTTRAVAGTTAVTMYRRPTPAGDPSGRLSLGVSELVELPTTFMDWKEPKIRCPISRVQLAAAANDFALACGVEGPLIAVASNTEIALVYVRTARLLARIDVGDIAHVGEPELIEVVQTGPGSAAAREPRLLVASVDGWALLAVEPNDSDVSHSPGNTLPARFVVLNGLRDTGKLGAPHQDLYSQGDVSLHSGRFLIVHYMDVNVYRA